MTTTDRELLQRAAKAAGIELNGAWAEAGGKLFAFYREIPGALPTAWAPLHDDGDEARLEAACNIDIEWHTIGVVAIINDKDLIHNIERFREPFADHGGDKQKARRYAGTRAAAAMGGE